MTVAELIESLKHVDQTLTVVRAGYEGGYVDVSGFRKINLRRDVNSEWYYGPHEEEEEGIEHLYLG
jgi:hypothetical protein